MCFWQIYIWPPVPGNDTRLSRHCHRCNSQAAPLAAKLVLLQPVPRKPGRPSLQALPTAHRRPPGERSSPPFEGHTTGGLSRAHVRSGLADSPLTRRSDSRCDQPACRRDHGALVPHPCRRVLQGHLPHHPAVDALKDKGLCYQRRCRSQCSPIVSWAPPPPATRRCVLFVYRLQQGIATTG